MKLVNYYKEQDRFKGKNLNFINTNIEEYTKLKENHINIFSSFRNTALHLNLISNAYKYIDDIRAIKSYYDIYQYILQNWIFNDLGSSNEMLDDFKAKFNRYHTYVNDLVKIMNIPFAYNLARYKNLVIADIFNDKFLKKDENEAQENNN